MQLQSTSTLQKLVESLYQSPGQWLSFLEQLTQWSDARSARMLVLDKHASEVRSSIKYNIDNNYHQQYVDYYVNTCPWRPELSKLPDGQLYSTFLDFSCKQDEYYKSEFFNDWARLQNIHHGVCGTIYQNEGQKIQLLIQRSEGQGYFNRAEMDVFNTFIPHLRRVITMQQQFEAREARSDAIVDAQQVSALPLILLDHACRVSYVSHNAEQILANCPGLTINNQRLTVSPDPATRQRFQQLLADCIASAHGQWHQAGGWFPLKRLQGGSYGLLVMPLHPELECPRLSAVESFAAVFIYDPMAHIKLCADTLKAVYNITPAEAELLQALVQGDTLESYADRRSRSLHTIKSQLKFLFRKTGTSRQATLVNLISNGPACLRPSQPIFNL
jgi:DNA-binding CsgD family transcriptional regulator